MTLALVVGSRDERSGRVADGASARASGEQPASHGERPGGRTDLAAIAGATVDASFAPAAAPPHAGIDAWLRA
jgi:hypothetical protein